MRDALSEITLVQSISFATMKARPQQPIYPRPVSPLIYEPLDTKGCHIYYSGDLDADVDPERNPAKRRKIEKLGEQYLRGDGLFIMSASLQGSLEGWKNPWIQSRIGAAQRAAGRNRGVTEPNVPETTQRIEISRRQKPVVPETSVRTREWSAGTEILSKQPNWATTWNQLVHNRPDWQEDCGSVENLPPQDKAGRGKGNNQDPGIGQNWLKKIKTSAAPEFVERDDSPTPRPAKLKNNIPDGIHSDDYHDHKAQNLTELDQGIKSPHPRHDSESRFAPTPTLSATARNSNVTDLEVPLRTPSIAQGLAEGQQRADRVVEMQRERSAHMRPGDDARVTRFGGRQLNSKRASIHYLPPSTHLLGFEYRPAVREASQTSGNAVLDGLESSNKPQDGVPEPKVSTRQLETHLRDTTTLATEAPTEDQGPDGGAMPAASIRTHSAPPVRPVPPARASLAGVSTTTSDLPSAQIVPDITSTSANSYASTSCKMIGPAKKSGQRLHISNDDIPVSTEPRTDSLKLGTPSAGGTGDIDKPQEERHQHDGTRQAPRGRMIKPFSAFKSPFSNPPANPDTQAMLDAITPLGFSTVKTKPLKFACEITPGTATRPPQNARKRASFAAPTTTETPSSASGSSQGSIKDLMKTSKGPIKDGKTDRSKPADMPIFEGLDLDMETSNEEMHQRQSRPVPEASSFLSHGGNPPVDQAERTPTSSARPLTVNTTTSCASPHQDAQEARQNDVDEAGAFDLSSAMDDLGSFLGTWDPDRAAKELGGVPRSSMKKNGLVSSISSISR